MSEQKRREKNEQSELLFDFHEATARRPRWADLPHEAQRSVTELFARMLRQRRQATARSVAHEVEHE
jgi:hypothetical protein